MQRALNAVVLARGTHVCCWLPRAGARKRPWSYPRPILILSSGAALPLRRWASGHAPGKASGACASGARASRACASEHVPEEHLAKQHAPELSSRNAPGQLSPRPSLWPRLRAPGRRNCTADMPCRSCKRTSPLPMLASGAFRTRLQVPGAWDLARAAAPFSRLLREFIGVSPAPA
jgi:hypothetical protein